MRRAKRFVLRISVLWRRRMTHFSPRLIIHGGAWDIPDAEVAGHLNGVKTAAEIGWAILNGGGSALDTVEAAIRSLEDDPAFDAGRGAWLNNAGEIELDAIIMNGANLNSGAVAAVQHIRNPISLARLVMERSPHSLLVAKGARTSHRRRGSSWSMSRNCSPDRNWSAGARSKLNQVFQCKPLSQVILDHTAQSAQ
jgi:isoaspartyl peptidase/L-asparaginase-like protein (Ntn-hydrolase superfamily)